VEWPAGSGRSKRLAARAVKLLGEVERKLAALEAEVGDEHPDPLQLERLARGELRPDEIRPLIRHLVTGCHRCAAVLRPLVGMADLPLLRPEGRRSER
jgi:hypothetical protein